MKSFTPFYRLVEITGIRKEDLIEQQHLECFK